jgi:hypothetical protein
MLPMLQNQYISQTLLTFTIFLLIGPAFAVDEKSDFGLMVDALPDANRYKLCPELRNARFHLERAKQLCIGCDISPYATEESIQSDRADAEKRLTEAQSECLQKEAAASKAKNIARLPEPKIGMTRREVLSKTKWGQPSRINSTETANSLSEQWVYPDGNYLYFKNNVLISIQRRN